MQCLFCGRFQGLPASEDAQVFLLDLDCSPPLAWGNKGNHTKDASSPGLGSLVLLMCLWEEGPGCVQLPEYTQAGVPEGTRRAGGQRGITGAGGGQGAAVELAWLLSLPWCGGEGISLSESQSLDSRFQLSSDGS